MKRNYLVIYQFKYGGIEYIRDEIVSSSVLELIPELITYIKIEIRASLLKFVDDYTAKHNILYFFSTDAPSIINIIPMNIY